MTDSGQTRGQLIQERTVEDIARDPNGNQELSLTCRPDECTPDELTAPNLTAVGPLGLRYQLGPIIWDGDNVTSAQATTVTGSSVAPVWAVAVQLDAEGTNQLLAATSSALTADAPQNQLGIVLNGRVITAPTVQAPIASGGVLIVPAGFEEEDVKALAATLSPG